MRKRMGGKDERRKRTRKSEEKANGELGTSFVDLKVESGATGVRFIRTRIRNRTHEQKTAPIK